MSIKLRNHPSKQALLTYAENLVDDCKSIDRSMAAHIVACPQCNAEVKAIEASLSFAASAPELDPGAALTARILMAGSTTRSEMGRRVSPVRMLWKMAQVGACAAGMLLVAGLTFHAFLGSSEPATTTPSFERSMPVVANQGRSPEAIRQAAVDAAEVKTLSAALSGKHATDPSPEVLEEMRVVQSRDADIAAAVSALERNPGSERAAQVVQATLKQQAESLRNFYVQGGSL